MWDNYRRIGLLNAEFQVKEKLLKNNHNYR
jgi:hypothetical protein